MRVINKLTKPGDIRRVDLTPDIVRILTSDGQDRVYRLVSEYAASKGVRQNEDNSPLRS
jgi:hypothetical protein